MGNSLCAIYSMGGRLCQSMRSFASRAEGTYLFQSREHVTAQARPGVSLSSGSDMGW